MISFQVDLPFFPISQNLEFVSEGVLFPNDDDSYVWIGLEDSDKDDLFSWTDRSDTEYFCWQSNQPDSEIDSLEDFGKVYAVALGEYIQSSNESGGNWNDFAKDKKFRAVCQINPES